MRNICFCKNIHVSKFVENEKPDSFNFMLYNYVCVKNYLFLHYIIYSIVYISRTTNAEYYHINQFSKIIEKLKLFFICKINFRESLNATQCRTDVIHTQITSMCAILQNTEKQLQRSILTSYNSQLFRYFRF